MKLVTEDFKYCIAVRYSALQSVAVGRKRVNQSTYEKLAPHGESLMKLVT